MADLEAAGSFLATPQPVEVLHAGVWRSAELLGWRHEPDGTCRVRVRGVVGSLRHTAWMDLAALRLPPPAPPAGSRDEPAPEVAPEVARPPAPRAGGTSPATPASGWAAPGDAEHKRIGRPAPA